MGDSTDENGWGLPSAAFRHSLCPSLPSPWPPQRPDLIPPWQDPAERQRAARAAAEAERARADEEETLQFIQDYVQALRDWRKEIVFHWGDHVIGRTTISLFTDSPAGEPAQPSPVPPAAGGAGTNVRAGDAASWPAEPVIVSSDGPAIVTRFGPDGQTMTDTVPNDGSPEQIVVAAPRPTAPEERPVAAPSRPSSGNGFPFSFISSAQAQEVPETEVDPALEEEVARNEEVFRAREIALEREALAQRADLPTPEGDNEIKVAVANGSSPLEPFLTPRNPALDALATRLRAVRTNPVAALAPVSGLPAVGEEAANTTGPAGVDLPALRAEYPAEINRVSTFKTIGVQSEAVESYLVTQQGQQYLQALSEADSAASPNVIYERAARQLMSGSNIPEVQSITSPLVKIVPQGQMVSPYSPFFTTMDELNRATASGNSLASSFGLPIKSEAPVYDVYQISPIGPQNVFVSNVAPASELGGLVERSGGAAQYLVPNRSNFNNPVLIGTIPN